MRRRCAPVRKLLSLTNYFGGGVESGVAGGGVGAVGGGVGVRAGGGALDGAAAAACAARSSTDVGSAVVCEPR